MRYRQRRANFFRMENRQLSRMKAPLPTFPTTSFHRGETALVDLERAHLHRRRLPRDYTLIRVYNEH